MANSLFSHALREYKTSFAWRRKAPGGRDFLWLSLAMSLLLTVGIMLGVVYEGMINKFADSLVGHVENVGSPIWVTRSFDMRGSFNREIYNYTGRNDGLETGLERAENEQFAKRFPYLKHQEIDLLRKALIYPYSDVLGYIDLPTMKITKTENGEEKEFVVSPWKTKKKGGRLNFDGWAVRGKDPIWQRALIENGFTRTKDQNVIASNEYKVPLEIVLPRKAFKDFDFQAYRNALKSILPQKLSAQLPSKMEEMHQIWLSVVSEGQKSEFLPFKVLWVDSLPSLQEKAFIILSSTFDAMRLMKFQPGVPYFFEGESSRAERIRSIRIKTRGKMLAPGLLKDEFVQCLKRGQLKKVMHREMLHFEPAMPRFWLESCLPADQWEKAKINIKFVQNSIGLKVGEHSLHVPCGLLGDSLMSPKDLRACENQGGQYMAKVDYANANNEFSGANVYVSHRSDLVPTKDALLKVKFWGEKRTKESKKQGVLVFALNALYEDSLKRFGFLTEVLTWFSGSILLGGVAFSIYFFFVNLNSALGHRKPNYGFQLAQGETHKNIRKIIGYQLSLSYFFGLLIALLFVETTVLGVNYLFLSYSDAAQIAQMSLGLGELQLLPHLPEVWLTVGLCALGVWIICRGILSLVVRIMLADKHPIDLAI
ncbi:hypothetical protein [Terasakiella sp. SH-1]|uniref:hypothetical protein n=1 Tax=Terasakiella sp. SH-1 TaxID=2560057 RepID=UPI00107491F5|nr:hypothetical protein [Terasakiella sp. SH-1]